MEIVAAAAAAPAAAAAAPAAADARTRDRLLALLLDGPATAAALSERLGVTPAAVRRHLDGLADDGVLTSRQPPARGPRGRGRPARQFLLTDAGHAAGPIAYDDLAASALRFLAGQGGDEAIHAFAAARVAELETRYAGVVASADTDEQRAGALAVALSGEGYAASTTVVASGVQLCQHHCPVQHVAAEFPQLCAAETEVFARLLGRHVQRLATIAHGDGVCTTHVPAAAAARAVVAPVLSDPPAMPDLPARTAVPSGRTSA